jgi:cysteine synthase
VRFQCVITMAEPFSVARRKLMRMMGAKVIVTPKAGKGTGMVEKAAELAAEHGWFLCHQFETDANWEFHEATTGPEIVNDMSALGSKLDYWVTGYGTGGTFHGAGKYIKQHSPHTKIVLAEPGAAALLDSGIKVRWIGLTTRAQQLFLSDLKSLPIDPLLCLCIPCPPRRNATRMAPPRGPTPPLHLIPSKVGLPTSFRWCWKRAST